MKYSRLELCEILRAGRTIYCVGGTLEFRGGEFVYTLWGETNHISWRDALVLLKHCEWE